MNYSRGNAKNDLLPVVWVLVAICLVLGILTGYCLWKQGTQRPDLPGNATGAVDSDQPETLIDSGNGWLEVKTPYGSLRYPDKWRENLRVYTSKDLGYRVQFSCHMAAGLELPLFDISIGEIRGTLVGYIATKDNDAMPVYLYTYSLLSDDALRDDTWDLYLAMQEELNQVLDQIHFTEDVPAEPEDVVIDTPYGNLTYPGEYKQYLRTVCKETGEDYTVEFYCDLQSDETWKLFAVTINGDPEGAVHTIKENGKNVHIIMGDTSLDGLPQEKQDLLLSMMEAVNDLLDALGR